MAWQSENIYLYARISVCGYHIEDLMLQEPWPSQVQQRPRYANSRGPCEGRLPIAPSIKHNFIIHTIQYAPSLQ